MLCISLLEVKNNIESLMMCYSKWEVAWGWYKEFWAGKQLWYLEDRIGNRKVLLGKMRKDRPAKLLLEFSIIGFSLASWDLIVSNWNFSMLPYWRDNDLLRNMGSGCLPSRTGSSHQENSIGVYMNSVMRKGIWIWRTCRF